MSQPFLFTRVGYSYVPTTNLDESIAWYTDHLELKLVQKFEDRGSKLGVLHFPHKNAIAVLLIETDQVKPLEINRNGRPFPVMALNCPQIEHTYERLKQNGVEVEALEVLGQGEAKYFYFRDNQGNYLEAAWSIWDPKDELKEIFEADPNAVIGD